MPVKPGQSPTAIALRKRLATNRLLPQDEERIEFATQIREGRARGQTFAQCAAAMGVSVKRVQEFANGQVYGTIISHLEHVESGADAQVRTTSRERARHRLHGLVPRALERLERALDAGESPDGTYRESRAADRAMELVLDAAGLLEPEYGAGRPPIVIDTLVIEQTTASIIRDDALARASADRR